jgi:hypothetical protein
VYVCVNVHFCVCILPAPAPPSPSPLLLFARFFGTGLSVAGALRFSLAAFTEAACGSEKVTIVAFASNGHGATEIS